LYLAWHTVKAFHRDDAPLQVVAYLLTGARNSRLTNLLVYERELASSVFASHDAGRLDGSFIIVATARPGHNLDSLQKHIEGELRRLGAEGPTARELEQARNAIEAQFLSRLEQVNGKADQLNYYYYFTGEPDYFQKELDVLRAVSAEDVQRVVRAYLAGPRVMLSIVPQGRRDLAATKEARQ
jgi:zinc protease